MNDKGIATDYINSKKITDLSFFVCVSLYIPEPVRWTDRFIHSFDSRTYSVPVLRTPTFYYYNRCDIELSAIKKFTVMLGVGFEPTPPERVHLKCNALDRSAIQAVYIMPLLYYTDHKKPTAHLFLRNGFSKITMTPEKASGISNIMQN